MKFPEFCCPVFMLGDKDYEFNRYQYATTSQPREKMSPAAIIRPNPPTDTYDPDDDIKKAIRYAAANKLAIAVRTGGHAYSGTSSTHGKNIQLDLSQAYPTIDYNEESGLVTVGVSLSLFELNTHLRKFGLFMPTGQCYDVHVGGHAQTGGYGQLSRAFGLFSDQIVSFEIFLADGEKRFISADSKKKSDKDLFFAVLGGGPGNYGIVTHITVRPFKDSDHQYSRAYKKVIPYDPKLDHNIVVQLFDLVQEWETAPGDYDFCFTVVAGDEEFIMNQIGHATTDDKMLKHRGRYHSSPFDVVMVFFQYSNLDNKHDTYDPKWCKKIKDILNTANRTPSWWERFKTWVQQIILNRLEEQDDDAKITPMSTSITDLWTYQGTREFNYPFLKYGQVTDRVASSNWSEWAATRVDAMTGRSHEGLMVFVQCMNFGGKHSAIVKNGARKQTSYAWRNTTVGYNFDIFYDPKKIGAQTLASDWHIVNRIKSVGPEGMFSKTDHRWFWASHDNIDMHKVWNYYYSNAVYDKCCKIKKRVDPKGVFSPNTFVVGDKPHRKKVETQTMSGHTEERLDDAKFTKGHAERAKKRAKAKDIDLKFR